MQQCGPLQMGLGNEPGYSSMCQHLALAQMRPADLQKSLQTTLTRLAEQPLQPQGSVASGTEHPTGHQSDKPIISKKHQALEQHTKAQEVITTGF